MNIHDMQRMMELKTKICPRPWVIVGPDKNKVYKMNYGTEHTIGCRDYDTLEFLRLASEFIDDIGVKRQPQTVDRVDTPTQA